MVYTEQPGRVRDLVDMKSGHISRDIFVSDELYQQELERVFARTWLFIGHTSQIPNPNDFFVSRMGEESVIMTRDRQGEVHVLLNTCRHRGMKVCRYDEGNTPVFSCPYHGWSYSTDGNLVSVPGELIGVPQFATAYHGELEKEEWGLISVPKMHVYKGSVWACWDKDAPEWDEYMGDMKMFLDVVFDGTDGEPGTRVAFEGVHKWITPSNWKLAAENFIGDGYHVISHRSAQLGGLLPVGLIPSLWDFSGEGGETITLSFPQGHGALVANHPTRWSNTPNYIEHEDPEINAYFKDVYEKRLAKLKGIGPMKTGGTPSTIFPNMSFGAGPTSFCIAVWHPHGARSTEIWRWYIVDKDLPPAVRDAWRKEQINYSGPAGGVEKDDMENWGYATEASNGTIARRYRYNYSQGMGHEGENAAFPGAKAFDYFINEQNQRGFYKRWAELMDAQDWDELRRWDAAV